jgi:hypothetical protein
MAEIILFLVILQLWFITLPGFCLLGDLKKLISGVGALQTGSATPNDRLTLRWLEGNLWTLNYGRDILYLDSLKPIALGVGC